MKKILIIGGAVVLALVLAAGSFAGGMAYQRNQANAIRAQFLASRGLNGAANGDAGGGFFFGGGSGNAAGNSGTGQQRRSGFGGGVTGQIKTVEGNLLTLSTAQDVTTVNLGDATRIQKSADGTLADLQPGVRVLVTGQRDSNGNITAEQIMILNFNPANGTPTPAP
jgi:hypothetical protein